jgi:hypothetical protein
MPDPPTRRGDLASRASRAGRHGQDRRAGLRTERARRMKCTQCHDRRVTVRAVEPEQLPRDHRNLMPGEALLCRERPRNRLGFAVTLNGLVDYHSHLCVLVDREGHGVSLEALQDDRLAVCLAQRCPLGKMCARRSWEAPSPSYKWQLRGILVNRSRVSTGEIRRRCPPMFSSKNLRQDSSHRHATHVRSGSKHFAVPCAAAN